MIPDFSTKVVGSNKLEFQYESAKEIISDFELMFQNCLTYNPPGSDITIITKIVQKFFNERVDWMNQLERTKIEIVIEPKEYLPKKSRGWPRGRPRKTTTKTTKRDDHERRPRGQLRKTDNKESDHMIREKWPKHMFTAKARIPCLKWIINKS